jgi:roadblock/LC7 domain-containing protein
MNRRIKTFGHDGEFLDDSVAMITRVAAENIVIHDMRDKGYARILDLDVGWYTQYDPRLNKWEYAIRAYGIYVGKRKARECQGWSQGKLIPRSTHQHMSNQS